MSACGPVRHFTGRMLALLTNDLRPSRPMPALAPRGGRDAVPEAAAAPAGAAGAKEAAPSPGADLAHQLALCMAASRGDLGAQSAVADLLYDRVRATVSYLVRRQADADDLVQETMIEILRSVGLYRGEGCLEAWADRITVRTSMRFLKRRGRRGEVALPEAEAADRLLAEAGATRGEAPGLERELVRAEVHRRMAALLERLKPERRLAVVLRWVHDYSIEEIAAMTEVRVNTARGRLRKGKRELRGLVTRDPVLRRWAELVAP